MTRRKDGRYQQKIITNGTERYFYGKTKAEVLRKVAAARDQEENGPTFRDVAEEYWRETEKRLSPTVVNSYRRGLRRAEDYFGDKKLREIRPVDISRFQDHLVREYRPAAKTLNNMMIVLRQIIKYGRMAGAIDTDPSSDIPAPKGLQKGKRRIASEQDVERIKNHKADGDMGLLAYMALVTGLRRGELLALTQDDIDRTTGEIKITKEAAYTSASRPIVRPPKTEAGIRSVFFPVIDIDILPSTPFIFGGDEMLAQSTFYRRWKAFQRRTGVSCTLHQLRHNFASDLDEAGFSVKEAQYLLGHANATTTMDIYQELRSGRTEDLRNRLNARK